jgi:hypothetical protein
MARKIKFTPKEVEMLEEMNLFPGAYNLTGKGKTAIKTIFEKVKKINAQE